MSKGAGFDQQREKSELEVMREEVESLKLELAGATDEKLQAKLNALEKDNAGLKNALEKAENLRGRVKELEQGIEDLYVERNAALAEVKELRTTEPEAAEPDEPPKGR